jgi:hypothetical protein
MIALILKTKVANRPIKTEWIFQSQLSNTDKNPIAVEKPEIEPTNGISARLRDTECMECSFTYEKRFFYTNA